MAYVEELRQGAAVNRRFTDPALKLLIDIKEQDPTADDNRLFRQWFDALREDEDALKDALRHSFRNLLTQLEYGKHGSRQSYKPDLVAVAARVEAMKARVKRIALLTLQLPSGKLLKDATFAECSQAGGWFLKVAKRGKPNQVVGKVLSEEQLREIK